MSGLILTVFAGYKTYWLTEKRLTDSLTMLTTVFTAERLTEITVEIYSGVYDRGLTVLQAIGRTG